VVGRSDELRRRRSDLSEQQREVLERRLRGVRSQDLAETSVRVRPDRSVAPLSFAQQRLWFLQQIDPATTAYNESTALRVHGPLDLQALAGAIAEVARRYDVLRGRFLLENGHLRQVISPNVPAGAAPRFEDLRSMPTHEREAEVARRLRAEAHHVFDLSTGPLFRTLILQVAETEFVVAHTAHHIVCDGWSVGVLIRELAALYTAFHYGRPAPPPPTPALQYADYAHWQRQRLQGAVLDELLAYWRGQVLGAPLVLEPPGSHARPEVQTGAGGRYRFVLPRELAAALASTSRQSGATLFMTLLAAFGGLLYRLTGQRDMLIGTPTAGRTTPELERQIGFFVNTLPLRITVDGDMPFSELVGRVREVSLAALNHQELPFERLVEEIQPERSLSRAPVFQVMFAFENFPVASEVLPELTTTHVELDACTAKLDLTLIVSETDDGLFATFEYSRDIFEVATVERLAAQLHRLLEAVAARPTTLVGDLPLMSDPDREALLAVGRGPDRRFAAETVDGLVAAQAERTPDRIAVECGTARLTYRELESRSRACAQRLQQAGVGTGDLVGVAVDRSAEMVAVLLGILKAGAAYLPLDPSFPSDRLRYMVADSGTCVVVTQPGRLEPIGERLRLSLDELVRPGDADVAVGPRPGSPEDLAYVLYTSGSTGRPKGVEITHRAVVNLLCGMREVIEPTADDVLLAITTLSFDIAGLEIFLPLTVGARTVVATRHEAADGMLLAAAVERSHATIVQATPSSWTLLLGTGWRRPGWRPGTILCGGEGLPWELGRALVDQGSRVWNVYGPTETTIWSTAGALEREAVEHGPLVPVGRPIANTYLYILDERLQPAPVGAPGELYIAGAGVARGYRNNPELSARQFVPCPFDPAAPQARMYRTGDRAAYRPDGTVEILGRTDEQVKVRGFRVEPREVEAVLLRHPSVAEAAVVAHASARGAHLSAVIVAGPGQVIDLTSVREHLQRHLPDYMVPKVLAVADDLPRTPNGKLDRREVAARLGERGAERVCGVLVPPRTREEEIIAGIWADLLEEEEVGVHDDFFESGGHSLLAALMVSRIANAFSIEVPVRWVFEAPTVAGLAARTTTAARSPRRHTPVPLRPAATSGPYPLSFAQEGYWVTDRRIPGVPFTVNTALQLTGDLDEAALADSLDLLIRRHPALRTTFAEADGVPVQVVAEPESFSLPLVDLTGAGAEERENLLRQVFTMEVRRPFDLGRGPLIRTTLVKLADDEHALLVATHHIVSDCWSHEVMAREVAALYRARLASTAADLPALPVGYGDYAVWERQLLAEGELEHQSTFWQKRLEGPLDPLDVPLLGASPVEPSYLFTSEAVVLAPETAQALRALARKAGTTTFVVLLAGVKLLLSVLSGKTDIRVSTRTLNRSRVELEGIVGLFVNTVVMRTDLSGDMPFCEAVNRVHRSVMGAYDHQDLPFDHMVRALGADEQAIQARLMEVLFVFQYVPHRAPELPGLAGRDLFAEEGHGEEELILTPARLIVDVTDAPDRMRVAMKADAQVCGGASLRALLGYYARLLDTLARNPDRHLSHVANELAATTAAVL
jgi:amino acid adenylation domain-containing protein